MAVTLSTCQLSQELYKVAAQVREVITNVLKEFCNVREALDQIEQEDSFEAHDNPQVNYEIEKIKQFLRELIINSGGFVSACKALARYSSNDRHVQQIKDDLENGNVGKLKRFVKDIFSRMARCRISVDKYQAKYNELKTHVDQVMTEASKKVEQKAEKVRDLHNVSRGTGVASGVAGAGAGVAGGCSIAAFAVSVGFPPSAVVAVPIGITSLVIGGILTFAAAGTGGVAVGFAIVKGVNEKERKILKQAADSVLNLQKEMHNSKTKVVELEEHLKTISVIIEGSKVTSDCKGLVHLSENPEHYKDGELESLYDIKDRLDELQEVMKEILKLIENERG